MERPESVHALIQRVRTTVGELTGAPDSLWNGDLQPLSELNGATAQSADGTFHLSRSGAMDLVELTQRGPDHLGPERLRAARERIQEVTASYARWAVPAGQPRPDGFTPTELGVSEAFAADNFNEVAVRTLPPELAAQVMLPEPPIAGTAYAQAARGFANAVDNLKGLDARPSESLRLMAGQPRSGIATAAASALVANSGVPAERRDEAIEAIATTIDKGFAELSPDTAPGHALMFGQQLGRQAHAQTRAFTPDQVARFVADPAVAPLRAVRSPTTPSTPTRKNAPDQTGKTRDR